MKIGIFSGSFNPVHTGHLMVANYCAQFCGLDRVWLMVSPCNPLKADRALMPQQERLEMCRMAVESCPRVIASDFEFSLPVPSYTYRTLTQLREKFPDDDFTLIIGADNWLCFEKWRDWQKILRDFHVLIYPRPGYPLDAAKLPSGVRMVSDPDAPLALISSTFVREAMGQGKSVAWFIPPQVENYIKSKNKLL